MGLYQRRVSPRLGPHCRYVPTCSEYARLAVLKYGVRRGLGAAARRLLRCHPYADHARVDYP